MNEIFVPELGKSLPLFVAGSRVPAGRYVNVETGRVIEVGPEDILPASLDGRVAAYVKRLPTWADIVTHPQAA
jgi:hypothetical protein